MLIEEKFNNEVKLDRKNGEDGAPEILQVA